MMALSRRALTLAAFFLPCFTPILHALPAGFTEVPVGGTWNEAVGLKFMPDGRLIVWERTGKVWIVENGVKSSQPLLDISEEVGGWRDYGCLGLALHPNFSQNGYIYLLYVVDRHHLLYYGTPSYDPTADLYYDATIGRVTRYTAKASDNFRSVDPASRLVLIGQTKENGFPILHQSHGTGSLAFGADGTLLAACGDSASYIEVDSGGQVGGGYRDQAIADGILKPKEDVGAFRSQLVDCLGGKILRLDPNTGAGVPSNPFYDPADPFAPRSRVWALGLRNPYRMTVRPGTGSTDPSAGNPGAIYMGDVGWNTWEELDVCTGPGQNFGWPLFEGLTQQSGYWSRRTANPDAPNPLFGINGCTKQSFDFQDLIQQDTLASVTFPNPCNTSQSIPPSIPTFVHVRPAIDWMHSFGPSRTGIYNGDTAAVVNIGAPDSPVSGPQFGGNASTGGAWYTGTNFPVEYQNSYFNGDYAGQWIQCFHFDASNRPVSVAEFVTGSVVVAIAMSPDGALYHVSWPSSVYKITYGSGINQPPVAVATANRNYGPSPLAIQLFGSGSSDPNGDPLSYEWDFGDGSPPSTEADPAHTFTAAVGVPTRFDVTLTVRDPKGLSSQASLIVSVNNTPPNVQITSPADGTLYPMTGDFTYNLTANISDAEQGPAQLSCVWQTALHHDDHTHPEPADARCSTTAVTSPVGCYGHLYFYRMLLTVTDAAGLSSSDFVDLYPDCGTSSFDPTLVAAYAFSEGSGTQLLDSTPGNNDGAVQGATWTPDGKFGSALSFNGVNNLVVIPDSASLDLTSGMTLEAWVYPTGSLSGWHAILQKEVDTYFLHASSSGGGPAAGVTTGSGVLWQSTGSSLPLNAWSHLAATFDGTTLLLCVNGTQVASRAISSQIVPSGTPLRIGGDTYAGEFFQGRIDEVRIYNVALPQSRIQTDMTIPVGGQGPPPPQDTQPPAVAIDQPAAGATVSGTILVAATASDNVAVAGVQFLLDGNLLGPELTQAPYTDSWNTATATNGPHALSARARDAAGNTTTTPSISITLNNVVLPPPSSLVAAYSFDEGIGLTAGDASGFGNQGVLQGGPVWVTAGKFGGALSFDGVNDIVLVNDSSSLDLSSGMTLEAWVQPAVTPTYWKCILQKEVDTYLLHAGSMSGQPAAGLTSGGGFSWTSGGGALPAGVWAHLAATFDGAALRIYVNGVLSGSTAVSGTIDASGTPLRIGGDTYGGEFFAGKIDEVRIFNKARTQSEIQGDMQTPVTPQVPSVRITSPAAGAALSGGTVTVNYTVTGQAGSYDHLHLTLDGGVPIEVTNLNGTYLLQGLADGPHGLTAQLVDAAHAPLSNPEASSTVTFTVTPPDTTPPAVHISSPASGATVSGTVTLAATAADDVGVTGVQFILDGVNLGSEIIAPPYSSSWNSAAASNGTHALAAVARDAAGNTGIDGITFQVSNTSVLPQSLVAAYSFNAGVGTTAADATANANNGSISGATWTAAGKYGGALSFNGVNAVVQVPDSSSLDLTTGMTLEAWVYPTANLSGWKCIVQKQVDAYFLHANSNVNQPTVGITLPSGVTWTGAGPALPINTWTHLAATYDGSALKLYVNGVLRISTPKTGAIAVTTTSLRIGGNTYSGEFFGGAIDEVRIYNVARSAAEIQQDMASPISGP